MLDDTASLPAGSPADVGIEGVDPEIAAANENAQKLALVAQQALSEYHPLQDDEELATAIQGIVSSCKDVMRGSGLLARARINHNLYYARDGGQQWEENLKPDGEFGDAIAVTVNVLRNLVRHILSMVNSVKPVLDPKAASTDSESVAEAEVCRSLLDQYMYGEKHAQFINRAVEHAPVLAVGYVHRYIDRFGGGEYGATSPAEVPPGVRPMFVRGADDVVSAKVFNPSLCHENPNFLDVFFDQSATSWEEIDELVVRVYRNRYNLIVEYPEHADALVDAPVRASDKSDEYLPNPANSASKAIEAPDRNAKIEVWYYYHRKTVAVPDGKQALLLPTGEMLESGPLEWEEIPLYRLAPETIIGSVHAYSPTTSMGGLQEALNIGASAMISNIAAYARNVIVADKGSGIEPGELTGDMKLLEMQFDQNGNPPIKVLELLKLPPEVMAALDWMVGKMEQDAGVNKIVRGDPGSVNAGVAINLFEAMTQQFASPLEEARSHAVEWMADGIIEFHQKYPNVERDLQIIGKNKTSQLTTFYGDKIKHIRRVLVDMGNPMSRTVAGRLQMLQAIREQGTPLPPEKAIQLLNTGNLDVETEDIAHELNFILAENERLSSGQQCPVIPGDDHLLHIQSHRRITQNPDVRFDEQKLAIVEEHNNQHLYFWMTGDVLLAVAKGAIPMKPILPGGMPGAGAPPPGAGAAPAPHPGAGGPPPGAPPKKPADPTAALRPPELPRLPAIDQK